MRELPGLALLPGVRLDDMHAAQILLHVAAQRRHLLLDLQRALHDFAAEITHRQDQERRREQRGHGHAHVHGKHQRDRVKIIERSVDKIEDAGAEKHAHGRDVVDHAGHQVARALRVIIKDWELLQMGEEIVPEIVLDVAGGIEDERAGKGPDDPLGRRRQDDDDRVESDVADRPAVLDDPDGLPYPPRDPHDQRRGAEETERAEEIAPPVAPEVPLQSSHAAHQKNLYSTVSR